MKVIENRPSKEGPGKLKIVSQPLNNLFLVLVLAAASPAAF
jgi:hypothetical protein